MLTSQFRLESSMKDLRQRAERANCSYGLLSAAPTSACGGYWTAFHEAKGYTTAIYTVPNIS